MLAVTAITFAIFYLLPPRRSCAALRRQAADAREPRARTAQPRPGQAVVRRSTSSSSRHIVTGDKYGWPGLGYSYDSNVPIRDKIIEKARARSR